MSSFQMGLTRHLNQHKQSQPLILQFALSEFLQLYPQLLHIWDLIERNEFTHHLTAQLKKVTGSSPENSRFCWPHEAGALSKLYYYGTILSDKNTACSLESASRKAWIGGTDLLAAVEKKIRGSALVLLHKLQANIRDLAYGLIKMVIYFKENENVLFFLLRHQHQINTIYGKGFTLKLLENMFPRGLEEAGAFLIEKYSSRGFGHLQVPIQEKLSELYG